MKDEKKLYAGAPWPQDLEPYYCNHVSAMTREGLHSKSDIAQQLAWRDKQIADSKRAGVEACIAALEEEAAELHRSLLHSEAHERTSAANWLTSELAAGRLLK
jgi:hypothetical protein